MMIHKTIEDLKNRPQHERAAVARLIAIAFAAVLLIAWAYFFFSSIKGTQQVESLDSATNQTAQAFSAAQTSFTQQYASTTETLQQIAVAAELQAQRQADAAQSATGTPSTDTSDSDATSTYTQ